MTFKIISRRWFLKTASLASMTFWGALSRLWSQSSAAEDTPAVDLKELVAALGDTLIPTDQGYPGYRRLEGHGITDEVLKGLQGIERRDFAVLNAATRDFFNGRLFVNLNEQERTRFLQMVVNSFPRGSFGPPAVTLTAGSGSLADALPAQTIETVQMIFRLVRIRVMTVFYQNFPENKIARDANRIPILPAGDQHQILDPNTSELVTGWDVANFPGPLSWAEEEERRARWMKIHWHSD